MCFIHPILQKKGKGKQTIQAASGNTEIEECCITNEPVPNSVHLQPSQVPGTSHAVEMDTTIQDNCNPIISNNDTNQKDQDYASMGNYLN